MKRITSYVKKSCFFIGAIFLMQIISAFNSQEHKIIADVGFSRIVIPASFVFPDGISMNKNFNYLSDWKSAKMLAVGFTSNNTGDYDNWKKQVQDNCYWSNYGQLGFNQNNYIETNSQLWPVSLINIDAYVGDEKEAFSFGDLVAIYGDYRRTVTVNGSGDCYLTDDKNNVINFSGNTYGSYCPNSISTADYLHKIAFGLCPPYGKAGNYFGGNTAGDDQYSEAGWWGDEMLRIANVNETHFSNVAIAWYIGMHRSALLYVKKAIESNNPAFWKAALHCEASALHSLTDLFSLGHAVVNRDECSYNAIKKKGLQDDPTYKGMEKIIKAGGGKRLDNGILSLSPQLPFLYNEPSNRYDFMPSYLGTWASWGKAEHDYHDYFNNSGGIVRNFNGDRCQVYGDFKLHDLDSSSRRVIEHAVTASVQSLFDYFDMIKKEGKSPEELDKNTNIIFAALKYAPVFVEKDKDNYFYGMWIPYANTVKSLLKMGDMKPGWENCCIPFLSGKDYLWPSKQLNPCAAFQ